MQKISCGLLIYKKTQNGIAVFLGHPGGPFFANRDDACWSIPKGEVHPDEEYLEAARRETYEETGQKISGEFSPLQPVSTPKKIYYAWAVPADIDPTVCQSNNFDLEWPPKSKKIQTFPEIDRYGWFGLPEAKIKINPTQLPFLNQLPLDRT